MRAHQTSRLTRRMSAGIAGMSGVVGTLNFVGAFFEGHTWVYNLLRPQVWTLALFAVGFTLARFLPETWVQILQVGIILGLSGPMVLSGPFSFFGMWFFVLGILLMYKYGFLARGATAKVTLTSAYFVPFLIVSVLHNEGGIGSVERVIEYFLFLLMCLMFLYFIFEEEMRDLMTANRDKESALADKNTELARQASRLARLEPLSVLGERVAYVTHSFKNHLAQLSAVAATLEETNDARQGAALLHEVTGHLTERIENILMVSRAGIDLEPETFDAARVLEGMKFVYLSEPNFADHVWHEMTIRGTLTLHAVRWDFILMVENILKNALDAIRASDVRGIIRVDLTAGLLTISNNGGAMDLCTSCTGYCLDCQHYGKGGSGGRDGGVGLNQVFGTCRKNGWALRIRTDEDWTIFQILLAVPTPGQTEGPLN